MPAAACSLAAALTLTIAPPSERPAAAARHMLRQLVRLMSNIRRQAVGSPSTFSQVKPPAMLATTSAPPSAALAWANARAAASASVRSTPPTCVGGAPAGAGARSMSATDAPSASKACATALPSVPKPPVINTRCGMA